MTITDWTDVVFLDGVGVAGKQLSQALADYADESEAHDEVDGVCHCYYCQVWIPMAMKLEKMQAALLAACDEAHVVLCHYDLTKRPYGVDWKPVDELQEDTVDQLWEAILLVRSELRQK